MDHIISPLAKDSLMEVMNIGAGNASTALSQMMQARVDITTPRLDVLKVEQAMDFVGKPDSIMSVVMLKVLGDAPGVMMLMFPKESAQKIANALTHRSSQAMMDEVDRSVLREVGNVLAGACLNSLSTFLKMSFIQAVPNAATDMVGALFGHVLADLGQAHEHILASEVHFQIPSLDVEGGVFFIFDPLSTTKIIKATESLTA